MDNSGTRAVCQAWADEALGEPASDVFRGRAGSPHRRRARFLPQADIQTLKAYDDTGRIWAARCGEAGGGRALGWLMKCSSAIGIRPPSRATTTRRTYYWRHLGAACREVLRLWERRPPNCPTSSRRGWRALDPSTRLSVGAGAIEGFPTFIQGIKAFVANAAAPGFRVGARVAQFFDSKPHAFALEAEALQGGEFRTTGPPGSPTCSVSGPAPVSALERRNRRTAPAAP
jgi:hypothetical protein